MNPTRAQIIAEAYRWQRRLGNTQIATPYCHIVTNPLHPDVWDSNHADAVAAQNDKQMDDVFQAMDQHLAHTPWRVIHTDCFTPEAVQARLAFDGFTERPLVIQMALSGEVKLRGAAIALHPVISDDDWATLLQLVIADHAEGRRTGGLDLSLDVSVGMVAGYRAKGVAYPFYLAMRGGQALAYGACAAAPNGAGMIEDLFTLPLVRRQGIATAMIAAFTDQLRSVNCHTIFLGALASEPAKDLYAHLGFRPVTLTRSWVREVPGEISGEVFGYSGKYPEKYPGMPRLMLSTRLRT